jgi:hypothetical protein
MKIPIINLKVKIFIIQGKIHKPQQISLIIVKEGNSKNCLRAIVILLELISNQIG